MRATLVLGKSRFCLTEDAGPIYAQVLLLLKVRLSFIIWLVIVVVKGFGRWLCHLIVGGATLMTNWRNNGKRSVFRKVLMRYYLNFPSAEGLSSFSEAGLTRLPTATEAEGKQVISAQLISMRLTERMVVVAGKMAKELNNRDTKVEFQKHSNGRTFTVSILQSKTKQHLFFS